MAPTSRRIIVVVIAATVGTALFVLGRVTHDTDDARADGYFSGLRHGESRGIQEGRALQLTQQLPRDARKAARAAFDAGYAEGADDAFGGYDGGWYVSYPYLITLAKGSGTTTYDLDSRTMLHRDVDYFLCPHTHTVCERPHH